MTKNHVAKGTLQRSSGKDQEGEGPSKLHTPDCDLKTYSAPNREG